jgi:hypothetical protein
VAQLLATMGAFDKCDCGHTRQSHVPKCDLLDCECVGFVNTDHLRVSRSKTLAEASAEQSDADYDDGARWWNSDPHD